MSTRTQTLSGRGRTTGAAPSVLAAAARAAMRKRLAGIEGGRIAVTDPWGAWQAGPEAAGLRAEVRITDPRFYTDGVAGGPLGLARAFMDGYWRCDDLAALFRIGLRNRGALDGLDSGPARVAGALNRWRHRRRRNTRAGSRRNIYAHYDLGNDLFALFLDPSMTYSAAVFAGRDEPLAAAQARKLDRLCRKLALAPGHRVLEIGCGWGSFAIHAARHYGCHVTATTISPAQHELAAARIAEAGLSDRITLLLEDYRKLEGRYDRVISIEMIEAVGHEYLPAFFGACAQRLEPDGAMALQAIAMPDQRYARYLRSVDFIKAYVFPGCCVPSRGAMLAAVAAASDMSVLHMEDMALHYAETLRRWRAAFMDAREQVLELGYGERFLRLWDYYLQYCEAGFEERYLASLQLVLARPRASLQPCVEGVPAL